MKDKKSFWFAKQCFPLFWWRGVAVSFSLLFHLLLISMLWLGPLLGGNQRPPLLENTVRMTSATPSPLVLIEKRLNGLSRSFLTPNSYSRIIFLKKGGLLCLD